MKKKSLIYGVIIFMIALILGGQFIRVWWFIEFIHWVYLIGALFGLIVFIIQVIYWLKNGFK